MMVKLLAIEIPSHKDSLCKIHLKKGLRQLSIFLYMHLLRVDTISCSNIFWFSIYTGRCNPGKISYSYMFYKVNELFITRGNIPQRYSCIKKVQLPNFSLCIFPYMDTNICGKSVYSIWMGIFIKWDPQQGSRTEDLKRRTQDPEFK